MPSKSYDCDEQEKLSYAAFSENILVTLNAAFEFKVIDSKNVIHRSLPLDFLPKSITNPGFVLINERKKVPKECTETRLEKLSIKSGNPMVVSFKNQSLFANIVLFTSTGTMENINVNLSTTDNKMCSRIKGNRIIFNCFTKTSKLIIQDNLPNTLKYFNISVKAKSFDWKTKASSNNASESVMSNLMHLTHNNTEILEKFRSVDYFQTDPQMNPWIHLDLEHKRFIDEVNIIMKVPFHSKIRLLIGFEIPETKGYDWPLDINTVCGSFSMTDQINKSYNISEDPIDWTNVSIACNTRLYGTQLTIQQLNINPEILMVKKITYKPNPGMTKIYYFHY